MAIGKDTAPTLIEVSSDTEEEQERPERGRKSGNKSGSSRNKRKNSEKGLRNNRRKTVRRHSDVEVWTVEEKKLEDDECFILPSDPLAEVDINSPSSDDFKLDDVSVVSERGKVACRDYPHPRHNCAKYPFGKTSHEKYCSQCFCYVCDIAAPCKYWRGKKGHCHASSADKDWNVQRKTWRSVQNNCHLNPCDHKA